MRKAGVPESGIREITDHSTPEMLGRHKSIDAADAKQEVERMELLIRNVDQNVDQVVYNEKKRVTKIGQPP